MKRIVIFLSGSLMLFFFNGVIFILAKDWFWLGMVTVLFLLFGSLSLGLLIGKIRERW